MDSVFASNKQNIYPILLSYNYFSIIINIRALLSFSEACITVIDIFIIVRFTVLEDIKDAYLDPSLSNTWQKN